jgi:hypothetical protein
MTFSVQTLSAYKMGSMVRVSNELLHDSAFDIAGYISLYGVYGRGVHRLFAFFGAD